MRFESPKTLLGAVFIALLLACTGRSNRLPEVPVVPPPPPPAMTYADPTGTGWKLVRNAQFSSGQHLVLDLMGPAGVSSYGVALTLDLGPDAAKATWSRVQPGDASLARSAAFNRGGAGEAFKSVATPTGALVTGTYTLGAIGTPVTYKDGQPLLTIALDPTATVKVGDVVVLSVTQAQELQAGGFRPIRVNLSPIQIK